MAFAAIDGVRLHHEISGEGPPLVLSYCLGGNLTFWQPQAQILAQHYRVILWDPRGHGRSAAPTDPGAWGITRSAQDLAALLDHLGIERAHVGGLSMGGGIAARFAQLYPQRPLSVSILDSNTAAAQPVPAKVLETREQTALLCEAGDMQAAARFYLANSPAYRLFAADNEANRKRLQQMVAATDPVGFANTLRAMAQPEGSAADLARIVAPTLVMAGEHDPAMAAIRITHDSIPGSRLAIVGGAGHLANIDSPLEFTRAFKAFLDSVAQRDG